MRGALSASPHNVLLWLQFGAYLWACAWHYSLTLTVVIVTLVAAYGVAQLRINRITVVIKHRSGAVTSPNTDLQ